MARIVAEKSESSFSQVIHSAGVRRFGEAQAFRDDNSRSERRLRRKQWYSFLRIPEFPLVLWKP